VTTIKTGAARRGYVLVCLIVVFVALVTVACGDDDDDGGGGATPTSDQLDRRTFEVASVKGQKPVAGSTTTFTFEDGGIAANAGCNTMTGSAPIENGRLMVGPLAQTQMACDDALQQQDVWLASFLEAGPTVALDNDRLTLQSSDVTIVAIDRG
jgi:heat shock protein HslJ